MNSPAATTPRVLRAAPVVLLLLLFFVQAISGVWNKSTTFDEIAHLTAGHAYWLTGDYRLHPENGNLPQRLATLPAQLLGVAFPSLDNPYWHLADVWLVGREFFYDEHRQADRLLLSGRIMIGLLAVALGVVVYLWSSRLFGRLGGLFSLTMYCFCPTLLANGALATSDLTVTFFFLTAIGSWWLLMHRLSPATLAACSLAMSGLFLSKFSAPIVVPVGLGLLMLRLFNREPLTWHWRSTSGETAERWRVMLLILASAATVIFVTWVLIWACYGFRYQALVNPQPEVDRLSVPWEPLLERPGIRTDVIQTAREMHLLPEAYLFGLAYTLRSADSRSAFFCGEFGTQGWVTFFPFTFLTKTTLPMLLLLAALPVIFALRWRSAGTGSGKHSSRWWQAAAKDIYQCAPLWLFVGVYWLFVVTSHLNIGHRHLLPTYPALLILVGVACWPWQPKTARGKSNSAPAPAATDAPHKASSAKSKSLKHKAETKPVGALAHQKPPAPESAKSAWRGRVAAGAILFCALWQACEALSIWPNHLAYFNELIGPDNAYHYLVDSSLDWGQDLPALQRWLELNGPSSGAQEQVYLSYFGTGDPAYYGIKAIALPGFFDHRPPLVPPPLGPGLYCISATMLQNVYTKFPGPWTAQHEKLYQERLTAWRHFMQVAANPAALERLVRQHGEQAWGQAFQEFEHLRLARLCATLRNHEPIAKLGYSIMVYPLTAENLQTILEGPPPWLQQQ